MFVQCSLTSTDAKKNEVKIASLKNKFYTNNNAFTVLSKL